MIKLISLRMNEIYTPTLPCRWETERALVFESSDVAMKVEYVFNTYT